MIKYIRIILLELIKDLNQVINNSINNESIKILNNGINKINYIINENKKNDELLRKNISSISDKLVINIYNYILCLYILYI